MDYLEIERKFLVKGENWRDFPHTTMYFRQGYLTTDQHCSVRVRIASNCAWLNLKSATLGTTRHEFEYEIPVKEAHAMLTLFANGTCIEKTRYFVEWGSHIWEIDVFEGDNAGLIVAELELRDPNEAFEKPEWLGAEVTHDPRYYNTCLSLNPYKNWRE